MTQSKRRKHLERKRKNRSRFLKVETVMFITMLKFPKDKLISVSNVKDRTRRALENEFKEAEIIL